ncbi:MAG TPA: serine/threonine-protein kinase [Fimbriiglobus sp.]|jgi:serine/threonine-protein kinase
MMIGQKIGQFEIHKELGSGAMGTVYKATLDTEGKFIPVALKVVALGLLGNESAMARFDREAKILKQLKHRHIVRLIANGRYKQTPFIAMEFVDGEALDRMLQRRGRLGWEEVAGYAKQLCSALQYAHEKGIIHRDLKPSNLMITTDGILKLTDFGIAKDTDVTALTGANSTIGTASYMSPEQCKGERNLTAKSDLYSLGVVLYELISGKKPFVSDSSVEMFLKHVNEIPVRPSRHVADLPVWIDNLIMFLLEKEKENRPMDAATVGRMIEDIEEKVHNQQSAGAEVANARRIDRLPKDGPLSDEDREIARMLRSAGKGKKRRKKRAGPWYSRRWVKALPLIFALTAIGVGLFFAFKPASRETLLAQIESAASDEGKIKRGEEYLSRYGNRADETTEKVRGIVIGLKGKDWEAVLGRRHDGKVAALKKAPEGSDEEAYQLSMLALDAEQAGKLGDAAADWSRVKDRLAATDDKRKSEWTWVADKRKKDCQAAAAELAKIRDDYHKAQLLELPWKFDPTDAKSLATLAYRYEAFGDKLKAREKWLAVLKETDGLSSELTWNLLAAQQVGQLAAVKIPDPVADRVRKVSAYVAETQSMANSAAKAEFKNVQYRTCRNRCRDVIELYSDESNEAIRAAVQSAKALLESLPKPGGE